MRQAWWMLPLVAPGLLGARKGPEEPGAYAGKGEPAAVVDGNPIAPEVVRAAAERAGVPEAEALDTAILVEILYRDALARGLHQGDEGRARLAWAARESLANAALATRVEQALSPDRIEAAWRDDPSWHVPEVRASHILVATEAEAREVRAQLDAGADFAALAAKLSLDSGSAAQGGDLGWFTRERMVPEFAAAAFATPAGSLAGPVETQFGWHVLRVTGTRAERPFDEVRERVAEDLRDRIAGEVLDELRRQAVVVRADQPWGVPTLPASPVEVRATDLTLGPAAVPVTVVMYSDVQCPYCDRAWETVRGLADRGEARVVYKHYPLDAACNPAVSTRLHPLACEAARALVCDPRVELLEALFGERSTLDAARIRALTRDDPAVRACVDAPAPPEALMADITGGMSLGVEGTPTFFVNRGELWLRPARGLADLPALVNALRSAPPK